MRNPLSIGFRFADDYDNDNDRDATGVPECSHRPLCLKIR